MLSHGTRAAAASLVVAGSLAFAAADDVTTRVEDISDLVAAGDSALVATRSLGLLFTVPTSHMSHSSEAPDISEEFVELVPLGDEIADIVSDFAAEVDDGRTEVTADGARLAVRGNGEVQRLASGVLDVLRRSLHTPLRVDVGVFRLPPGTAVPGTPDDAAVARLQAAALDGGRRVTLGLSGGRWQTASSTTTTRVVGDVDVEIAEASQIADPIAHFVEAGVRVALRANPLTDGRAAVRVLAAAGDIAEPVRRLQLGPEELGALELPAIDASFVATELMLEAGRPVALSVVRPDGDVHAFVFRLEQPAYAASGGTFRVVPTGAAVHPGLWSRLVIGDRGPNWGDGRPWLDSEFVEADGPRLSDDGVVEHVARAIEEDLDNDLATLEGARWQLGHCLVLRGPAATLDRATATVQELERATVRHARLEVRFEQRAGSGREVVGRLDLPAPLGFPVSAAAYEQRSYVEDNDVEVAQNARIADPTVAPATGGVFANATVAAIGEAGHAVALDVRAAWLGATESMISGARYGSTLERVPAHVLSGAARLVVPAGGEAEIALGSGPGGAPVYVVVRVTR